MTELSKFVDGEATEIERTLLLSAGDDAPRPGARSDLLLALGVSGVAAGAAAAKAAIVASGKGAGAAATGAVGGTGAPGVAAAGGIAAGGAQAGAGTITSLVVVKWIGIGVMAGALTTGIVRGVSSRSEHGSTATSSTEHTTTAVQPAALPVALQPRSAAPAQAEQGAPDELAVKQAPAESPSSADLAAPAPNVAAEVALLDRARAALDKGDNRRALSELAEHERTFASGSLGPEAEVVRIEAMIAGGEKGKAAQRARAFLASHPKSPAASRVRSLLAKLAPEGSSGESKARASVKTTGASAPPAPPEPAAPTVTKPSSASFPLE